MSNSTPNQIEQKQVGIEDFNPNNLPETKFGERKDV